MLVPWLRSRWARGRPLVRDAEPFHRARHSSRRQEPRLRVQTPQTTSRRLALQTWFWRPGNDFGGAISGPTHSGIFDIDHVRVSKSETNTFEAAACRFTKFGCDSLLCRRSTAPRDKSPCVNPWSERSGSASTPLVGE